LPTRGERGPGLGLVVCGFGGTTPPSPSSPGFVPDLGPGFGPGLGPGLGTGRSERAACPAVSVLPASSVFPVAGAGPDSAWAAGACSNGLVSGAGDFGPGFGPGLGPGFGAAGRSPSGAFGPGLGPGFGAGVSARPASPSGDLRAGPGFAVPGLPLDSPFFAAPGFG
jgi:hypothetical protein